jgi:hypothetical protein
MTLDRRWSVKSRISYNRGFQDAKREDLRIIQDTLMEGSRKILFEITDKAKMAIYPDSFKD